MATTETPVKPSNAAAEDSTDIVRAPYVDVIRDEIPPAFYRDDDPPLPPADDPHWREWWHDEGEGEEVLSRWLLYGLPASLLVIGVLHAVLILAAMNHFGVS